MFILPHEAKPLLGKIAPEALLLHEAK